MDINTFTQKAQQAVLAAREGASGRNHQQVTLAHLAEALFGQPDTIILPLLARLEVDRSDITGPLRRLLEGVPQVFGAAVEVGFSPDTIKVLEAAEAEKSSMKDTYVSVEHILLALAVADGETGDLLRAAGLTKAAILGALAEVRGAQRVTSQTPEDTLAPLEQFGRDLVEAARQVGDPQALHEALFIKLALEIDPHTEDRLADGDELMRLGESSGNRETQVYGTFFRRMSFLELGQLARADQELESLIVLAEEIRRPLWLAWTALSRAGHALLHGRFTETEEWTARAETLAERAQDPTAELFIPMQEMLRLEMLGRLNELDQRHRTRLED
ncbi:MAG: hypothetical protein IH942_01310, partial [Acidobacteria bacterium]|nr:hypothetical protein [Acidobacteriota bacterium]